MDTREYVIFRLDNEYYGLNIHNVVNIEKISRITRVPYTRPYIIGIINLRGNVIPIIDLRKRFALNDSDYTEDSRIIIVTTDDITVGLVVDSSSETLQLSEDVIDHSPTITSGVDEKFIKEIGKHNNRIIMLLDINRVLGIVEEE